MHNRLSPPDRGRRPAEIDWRFALALLLSALLHLLLMRILASHDDAAARLQAENTKSGIEVTLTTLPKAKPAPPPPAAKPVPQAPKPKPAVKPPPPKPAPPPKPQEPRRPKPPRPQEPLARPKPPEPQEPPKPQEPEKPAEPPTPPELEEPQVPEPPTPEKPPEPEPPKPEQPPEPQEPKPQTEPPKPKEPAAKPKPSKRAQPSKETEPVPEFKDDFQQLSRDYSSNAAEAGPAAPASSAKPDTGVHPGAILNINPRIHYPLDALRKGQRGVVIVLIHISTDGHTSSVDLLKSSGYEELDNQVLGAVQHWRFTPPKRGNTPVESTYKHTVIFGADMEVIDDFATHWQQIKLQPAGAP